MPTRPHLPLRFPPHISCIFPSFSAGFAADIIPTLKKNFGVAIVDFMLLDHSAATYVSDVAVASAENFLATGAR